MPAAALTLRHGMLPTSMLTPNLTSMLTPGLAPMLTPELTPMLTPGLTPMLTSVLMLSHRMLPTTGMLTAH
jgi:hypothetical protein